MKNKLLTAQYILRNPSGRTSSGFNRKIYGESYNDAFSNQNERTDMEMISGWNFAEKLIDEGKIYYTYNFHKKECESSGNAFQYGGFWVCEECGKRGVDKPHWIIKVFKDGNEFCCVGENFVNLQESDNYSFGKSKQEAIENYAKIYNG